MCDHTALSRGQDICMGWRCSAISMAAMRESLTILAQGDGMLPIKKLIELVMNSPVAAFRF